MMTSFLSYLKGILLESFWLLVKMAPYLLFGLLFAGVLHIFFPPSKVARQFGQGNVLSVLKATLFGIPLPLCSCGVLPAAISLRKEGAARGPVLSFLISTPTSGVDSILATYSLLGPLFAAYRVLAAFVSGFASGILANLFTGKEPEEPLSPGTACHICDQESPHSHSAGRKLSAMFSYAFGELIEDIGKWLIVGLLIGGAIAYLIPQGAVEAYVGVGWLSMLIMLLVGIPLYVCATASIPVAAALMLKGMSPGAALVFLLAGPATNAMTVTLVARFLGRRSVAIHLLTISAFSVGFGLLLNQIWGLFERREVFALISHGELLPEPLGITASLVLLGLIGFDLFRKLREKWRR